MMILRVTGRGLLTALIVVLGAAATCSAAPTISFVPSLSAGAHLGEGAELTATLTLSGTEYSGGPDPLTEAVIELPAGMVLTSEGFPTCALETLAKEGPAGCPTGSAAGAPGSFVGRVDFGREIIEEKGVVDPFFAQGGGFLLYIAGRSPVDLELISRASYGAPVLPFGPAIKVELPIVETIPGGADMSWTSLTVNLGTFGEGAGGELASLLVPDECPSGSLDWRVDAAFVHEASAHAEAESVCPSAGMRTGTTTRVSISNSRPTIGESTTYTATVTSKVESAGVPVGHVTFFDGGAPIPGCEGVVLVPGATSSYALCTTTPTLGAHAIAAVYPGSASFLRSEAAAVSMAVVERTAGGGGTGGGGEEAAKQKAEAEAKRTAEEQARRREEEEARTAVLAALERILVPHGRDATLHALLKKGDFFISFVAPGPGVLKITWYEKPTRVHVARRSGRVAIAAGSVSFDKAGVDKVKVRLTAKGRRLLKHVRRVKLVAVSVLTPSGQGALSAEAPFTLTR
jgi:Bacterial Ig-like domain (group 3)